MEIYYSIVFFIFGTIFGSFYNVVGYRLPLKQSLIKPGSHCTKCNHKLGPLELIPVISYLFLRGKCKNCGEKVSCFYPIFETLTGLLFMGCYLKFGISIDLIIGLIFVSMLVIIFISDYQTYIIPDEVLIFSVLLISIPMILKVGMQNFFINVLYGMISFSLMFLLKKIGDFLFKKESMGGGDIKLMFVFGFVLGWQASILSVFIASFIGLPISLILLNKNSSHEIPFGPFLSIAAAILLFTGIDFNLIFSSII